MRRLGYPNGAIKFIRCEGEGLSDWDNTKVGD